MATGLRQLRQIAYVVHDLDAMTRFFEQSLGLEKLFAVPGMSFFDLGGVRLMLSRPTSEAFDRGNSILYFAVDDIDLSFNALKSKGIEFEREPFLIACMPDHELWMAFFRDPENNVLALSSEKTPL